MERQHSPPPTYDEATRDDPVINLPPYSEQNAAATQQPIRFVSPEPSSRRQSNRVSPHNLIVTVQPQLNANSNDNRQAWGQNNNGKKTCFFNCFCFACQCIRPCLMRHCFCFNCVLLLFYFLFCFPVVCFCWILKRLCPETFGDCSQRNWDLMDSYESREENFCSRCLWTCFGPCCCYTCDNATEVCPCADGCVESFGYSAIKKMVCFCANDKICDCRVEAFDEALFGYLCDIRECGWKWNNEPWLLIFCL